MKKVHISNIFLFIFINMKWVDYLTTVEVVGVLSTFLVQISNNDFYIVILSMDVRGARYVTDVDRQFSKA